jgi:predicted lipase
VNSLGYIAFVDAALKLQYEDWSFERRASYFLGYIAIHIGDAKFAEIANNFIADQTTQLTDFIQQNFTEGEQK